jgi:tetratricopeptide (TPR) repeat protein
MDTAEKVRESLKSWKEGDRLFDTGDFAGSATSYRRALDLSRSLPAEEEFDHAGFEASCNAGLSGSLGRLGKHRESLAAADAALTFFDRHGDMYPVEAGKWMMAVVNRGAALAMLDRPREALEAFQRAKKMLSDRGMNDAANREWMAMVNQNISSVQNVMRGGSKKSSPWWKFWA